MNGTIIRAKLTTLPATRFLRRSLSIAFLYFLAALALRAGEISLPASTTSDPDFSDLTLGNFFSSGWNQAWAKRSRGEGTPDMSLLRVQTNFLVRLFRTDLAIQQNPVSDAIRQVESLTETVEYPFNRRFQIAVVGNYQWLNARVGNDMDGGAVGAFTRIQLVDTKSSSLAMTLRGTFPNHGLDIKTTTISLAIEGWQDLASIGLGRTGLYFHLQEETQAGPVPPGSVRNDLTYDLSLAHTWTGPNAPLGNATTFVEAYGRTNLDGARRSETTLTLTPGVRVNLAQRHILMAGVDFPLTSPRPYDRVFRLTYIFNF
jgi:hypothetical protein